MAVGRGAFWVDSSPSAILAHPESRGNQGLCGLEHTRATHGAVAGCSIGRGSPGTVAQARRIFCPDNAVLPTAGTTTSMFFLVKRLLMLVQARRDVPRAPTHPGEGTSNPRRILHITGVEVGQSASRYGRYSKLGVDHCQMTV